MTTNLPPINRLNTPPKFRHLKSFCDKFWQSERQDIILMSLQFSSQRAKILQFNTQPSQKYDSFHSQSTKHNKPNFNFVKQKISFIYNRFQSERSSLWLNEFKKFCMKEKFQIKELEKGNLKLKTFDEKGSYILSIENFWVLLIAYLIICNSNSNKKIKFDFFIDLLKYSQNYLRKVEIVIERLFNIRISDIVQNCFTMKGMKEYCIKNNIVIKEDGKKFITKKRIVYEILKKKEICHKVRGFNFSPQNDGKISKLTKKNKFLTKSLKKSYTVNQFRSKSLSKLKEIINNATIINPSTSLNIKQIKI